MSARHAGSPADFSTALLNAVVEHVRQSARGVQFIDAAIPDCRLTAVALDCVMLRIETGTAQDALTRGFRADGGHSELRSCTAETLAAVIGQRTGWIYCGDRRSAEALEPIARPLDARLVLCASDNDLSALRAAPFADWDALSFVDADGGPTGLAALAAPGRNFGPEIAAPVASAWRKSAKAVKIARLRSLAQNGSGRPLRIPAHRLVCDAAYPSEGDEQYSWIWSGPGALLRMSLGVVSSDFRNAQIVFAPSPHHRDIVNNILVQINGRKTHIDLVVNSDFSARAIVNLPDGRARGLVIGIGCRSRFVDASGRMLRACIQAAELHP